MAYPNNNVHRRNRRQLGRGQGPFAPVVTTTFTPSGSTVTINFSRPVTIAGNLPLTVASLTFVSQSIVSPTQVVVTMSGAVATHAYNLPTPVANVLSYQGGQVLGGAGTF